MTGFRVVALSLALGSCALTQSVCYSQKADEQIRNPLGMSQDEKQGTTVTYQVQPFGCGPMSTYVNCDGIPFDLNGVPAGST